MIFFLFGMLFLPPSDGLSTAEQLLKVVSFDRNLEARTTDGLKLAVLCDPKVEASCAEAERFLSEIGVLERAGSKLAPVARELLHVSSDTELARALVSGKFSAIYVAAGLSFPLPDVIRASEESGVMTLAGDAGDVARGLAAGVSESGKIVINIGAAERCGVDIDPVVRQVAQRVGETSPDPERAKLSETLTRYRDAIRQKDMSALRALWPGLTDEEAAKVEGSMASLRSHEVALALLRIESDGGRLRARVRRADRLVTREGKTLVSGRFMEILFRRTGDGAWVIDSMAGA